MRRWIPALAAAALMGAVFVVAPVTAQTSGTISACINNSHQLTHVTTGSPLACPGQSPVSWPGNAGVKPSPSPTPTSVSPSPSPSPTTASPSPSPTTGKAWAWCSMSTGEFWAVPDGQFGVWTGEWNSSLPQTVCANSENDWQATFSAPAGNTEILTYPDVQLNYNTTQPAVSGLDASATASFAETMNANSGTSAEAGFDVWITGTGCNRCEVMIWTDTVNRGTVGGASDTGHSAVFGGTAWELWQNGPELIWYPPGDVNQQAGTVLPAQMLQDLQGAGYLPSDAAVSQFEFGWEIASTGGRSETFQQTGYSVTGFPSGN